MFKQSLGSTSCISAFVNSSVSLTSILSTNAPLTTRLQNLLSGLVHWLGSALNNSSFSLVSHISTAGCDVIDALFNQRLLWLILTSCSDGSMFHLCKWLQILCAASPVFDVNFKLFYTPNELTFENKFTVFSCIIVNNYAKVLSLGVSLGVRLYRHTVYSLFTSYCLTLIWNHLTGM